MNIVFSIVIPLYNKQNSIKKTIESVLNQTHQDFELLIINDGSTDKSIEIVSAVNDSRIKIINKKNGGVSSARNVGIINAKYNYVAFLDGDDLWKENYLSEMENLIDDYPDAKIFGSNYSVLKNNIYTDYKNYLLKNFRGYIDNYFKIAEKSKLFQTSAIIVSKDLPDELILFNENLSIGEDFDFWYRYILNYKLVFLNKPLTIYNMDDDNMVSNKKNKFKKKYNYLSEISKYESLNADLKILNNKIKIGKIPDVILNHKKEEFQVFNKSIDYSKVSLKYKTFQKFPYFLKKIMIKILYK